MKLLFIRHGDPDYTIDSLTEKGWKEAEFDLAGSTIKVAVVSGLGNAGRLLKSLRQGKVSYDFVEVMACRRGCIMGGGQPPFAGARTRKSRMEGIYKVDTSSNIRYPDENPVLIQMYDTMLKGKEHKLFHRNMQH